jgi:putative transposase
MARALRKVVSDYPYHLIQRGHDRRQVFLDDVDRAQYLCWLRDASREHGLAVHAYVLMDNHVHLLATPSHAGALSQTMQAMGRRYVRWFNHRHARSGTLWEGRFRSSLIDAETYLLACQRYIEANPVRAGMVASAEQWLWSSHRHYLGWCVDPLVTPHAALWSLGNTPFERESAYRQLFAEPMPAPQQEWLRSRVQAGKPIASPAFQQRLEALTGLRLVARPVGRPRRGDER